MRRRELLASTAGAVGGALLAGSLGATAGAQTPVDDDEILEVFTHRARRVRIKRRRRNRARHVLELDGREMPELIFRRVREGEYESHLLPFETHRRARRLAERLVEDDGVLFDLPSTAAATAATLRLCRVPRA